MLVILEGPDGAGKSTLCRYLVRQCAGTVAIHHGPEHGVSSEALEAQYMLSLRPALQGFPLILDRSWLSEPIYAKVCRKAESRITHEQRLKLEHYAAEAGGMVLLCLPPIETCLAAYRSGREELLDDEEQLRQVHEEYKTNLKTSLPVVVYDYTLSTGNLQNESMA